jgi:hypothetical protein
MAKPMSDRYMSSMDHRVGPRQVPTQDRFEQDEQSAWTERDKPKALTGPARGIPGIHATLSQSKVQGAWSLQGAERTSCQAKRRAGCHCWICQMALCHVEPHQILECVVSDGVCRVVFDCVLAGISLRISRHGPFSRDGRLFESLPLLEHQIHLMCSPSPVTWRCTRQLCAMMIVVRLAGPCHDFQSMQVTLP